MDYSGEKKFHYITQEVHIEGNSDCVHDWVEDEEYDNGSIKQIICKHCGQFETAVKEYKEEKKATFESLYRKFHEKIEPIKPVKLKSDGIYDDYVSLEYIRGYLVDKRDLGITYMEETMKEIGLEAVQVGFESSYFVIGVKFNATRNGIIDIKAERLFEIDKTDQEQNDNDIKEAFLKLGFQEEHLELLEIKSYVIGNYSY